MRTCARSSDRAFELAAASVFIASSLSVMSGLPRYSRLIYRCVTCYSSCCSLRTAPMSRMIVCVDGRRQWKNAKNIYQNAAIRSGLSAPLRLVRRG
jgi:hypothetical protein